MKTVIVGGVAGGASAAARLRRLDEHARMILFERGEHISFANCGLPYYLSGVIENRDDLLLQTPKSFGGRFDVDVRVKSAVTAIDRAEKAVVVSGPDGIYRESYDRLILSPGAEPIRPDIPGLDGPRVYTLRNVADAEVLRRMAERNTGQRAVIIGGGFIGLEVAENLVEAGLCVSLIEAAGHVLPPVDFDMAQDVHRHLVKKGVDLRLHTLVTAVDDEADGPVTVRFKDGEPISCALVVLAIGVRPDSHLASACGLETDERGYILVDEHMRTSDQDIYAVGDAVKVRHFVTGQPVGIPLAGPANRQGRIAADNIAGRPSVYKGTQGSGIVKVFDLTVCFTGVSEEAANMWKLDVDKVFLWLPSHATYYPGAKNMSMKIIFEKSSGRILGAQIVGRDGADKRMDVLAAAIRHRLTASDLTELELCYAPPYSSAKDPVNMAGFAVMNVLEGLVRQFHWHDVADLPRDGSVTLLDVRTDSEYAAGHIPGFIHVPLDSLREHLQQLDKSKPVYLYCFSGMRSYVACRILSGHGYDCYNLAGGWRLYESAVLG
ncbi:MAG: FAD-dependent oxidoreductase [Christensenellales bacterium]|jgi:NADPH-dependent 2,4-dienoyl-CoA reductase/sulfur reductase-like enzyme/rhodanese-related sulfurtransferase